MSWEDVFEQERSSRHVLRDMRDSASNAANRSHSQAMLDASFGRVESYLRDDRVPSALVRSERQKLQRERAADTGATPASPDAVPSPPRPSEPPGKSPDPDVPADRNIEERNRRFGHQDDPADEPSSKLPDEIVAPDGVTEAFRNFRRYYDDLDLPDYAKPVFAPYIAGFVLAQAAVAAIRDLFRRN